MLVNMLDSKGAIPSQLALAMNVHTFITIMNFNTNNPAHIVHAQINLWWRNIYAKLTETQFKHCLMVSFDDLWNPIQTLLKSD